jgi:hypothetical protein
MGGISLLQYIFCRNGGICEKTTYYKITRLIPSVELDGSILYYVPTMLATTKT